ncbi:hypothetical protein [Methyloceanibacter marginalis]|uniref:hypothetical protein n=1 Tax=Methyloceanibacter marginalis TaxID=1774971 RepID=UPI003CC7B032
MPDRIDELAERFGIAEGYISEKGDWVTTPGETKAKVLEAMGVPVESGNAGESDLPEPAPPRISPGSPRAPTGRPSSSTSVHGDCRSRPMRCARPATGASATSRTWRGSPSLPRSAAPTSSA